MAWDFGTDGVRARINTGPMRAEAVVRLALAAGRWFADNNQQEGRSTNPVVVIGKGGYPSFGYMLESALVAGFTSIGINCRLLGPVPTAAVSYLTHSMRADFGVMISASHNPHQDNGIKLFGPDGAKLADKIELEISELMPALSRWPSRTSWVVRGALSTLPSAIWKLQRPLLIPACLLPVCIW